MKRIINYTIVFLILISIVNADILDKKEQLLAYTKPMVNIFDDYQKYDNVLLKNLTIFDDRIEFIKNDSIFTFTFEKKIGANFSTYPRITERLNIYCDEDTVYYIEALGFSDIYSLEIGVGSHFLKNDYHSSVGFDIIYQMHDNLEFGIGLSDYTTFKQTNLSLFCDYTKFQIVNLIAGVRLHKRWNSSALSEDYNFPEDDENYNLKQDLFSSFFINPGIEFKSGNFSIRQGIEADFILLYGNSLGIAHQVKAVLKLNYRIF